MATHSAYDIYNDVINKELHHKTRFNSHFIAHENTEHIGRLLLHKNNTPVIQNTADNDSYITFINDMGNPNLFSLNNHEPIFSIDESDDYDDREYDSDWAFTNENELPGGKKKPKKRKTKKKMKRGKKTKKHRKKQMKKSRKKYKGGSGEGEIPSSSTMTSTQMEQQNKKKQMEQYLFDLALENQLEKNKGKLDDTQIEEMRQYNNADDLSVSIISKLKNQIRVSQNHIESKINNIITAIELPNLNLNAAVQIEEEITKRIDDCNSQLKVWNNELQRTNHSINRIMISTTTSIQEQNYHIQTLKEMTENYQLLIFIYENAITDFNNLYTKLTPIKETIVNKELGIYDDEEKQPKSNKKKPKSNKKKHKGGGLNRRNRNESNSNEPISVDISELTINEIITGIENGDISGPDNTLLSRLRRLPDNLRNITYSEFVDEVHSQVYTDPPPLNPPPLNPRTRQTRSGRTSPTPGPMVMPPPRIHHPYESYYNIPIHPQANPILTTPQSLVHENDIERINRLRGLNNNRSSDNSTNSPSIQELQERFNTLRMNDRIHPFSNSPPEPDDETKTID